MQEGQEGRDDLPERFPPMERREQPSIETRGDVMVALMRIDKQLHHNRNRGLVDWPFKPLSCALRALVAQLEAAEEGRTPVEDRPKGAGRVRADVFGLAVTALARFDSEQAEALEGMWEDATRIEFEHDQCRENETTDRIEALKKALRERTPVAYFSYGAIKHTGGKHSAQHAKGAENTPNYAGWFYHESEHDQWVGPFPNRADARAGCADVGDE